MAKREPVLLVGPLAVIAVVASAQCGAYALSLWPRSVLLWYLNLEVFRPVQYSLFASVDPTGMGPFCIVIVLSLLVGAGSVGKSRLPLAIASNLSFLYSIALLCGSCVANNPALAVNIKFNALWGPSFFLVAVVMLAAFVSSASAHRAYWREIFA
jgi:hypothetical protein